MTSGRETPEETAKLLFGMETPRDWLEKAKRERERFLQSATPTDKTDHAINFAITTSHLEDWVFHLYVHGNTDDWPEHQKSSQFDHWVRTESPAMLLLADLNNAAKHRVLDKRGADVISAEVGLVGYYTERHPIPMTAMASETGFSDIVSIHTVVNDDEIEGFGVCVNVHKLAGSEDFQLFVNIADEAIRFWEKFLGQRGL